MRAGVRGLVALVGLVVAPAAAAQDIEVVARERGLVLPSAYYELKQRDPTAYEFSRALFNRGVPLQAGGALAVPARTASESSAHASMTAARSGSLGAWS